MACRCHSTRCALASPIIRISGVHTSRLVLRLAARQPTEMPRIDASSTVFVKNVRNRTCDGNQRMQVSSRKSVRKLIRNKSNVILRSGWKHSTRNSTPGGDVASEQHAALSRSQAGIAPPACDLIHDCYGTVEGHRRTERARALPNTDRNRSRYQPGRSGDRHHQADTVAADSGAGGDVGNGCPLLEANHRAEGIDACRRLGRRSCPLERLDRGKSRLHHQGCS